MNNKAIKKVLWIIVILLVLLGITWHRAYAWTSGAQRYIQSNSTSRQVYEKNRAIRGRNSSAQKYMKGHNKEVHLGPSETFIRSRTVFCINCTDSEKEIVEEIFNSEE